MTTDGVDGYRTAEVRGVDVYGPTAGQTRGSAIEDIACWPIDIDSPRREPVRRAAPYGFTIRYVPGDSISA